MKLKMLLFVLESYIEKTEVLRLGKQLVDILQLKPVCGLEPPCNIGLTIIDKSGVEYQVIFKEVPKYWRVSGNSWKLDKKWFVREYKKLTTTNIYKKFKDHLC